MASNFNEETVTYVHNWTDTLFTFKTTRDPGFRFLNGQFAMIGLEVEGKPLVRAYSMVSANYDEELEFFSIKVPNGPLTSRLQHIKVGDKILVGRKPTGTLIHDNLLPGKNLWLLSTGTGLAPFMSVIRDYETYERYEKVILVHGCREVRELAYQEFIHNELPHNEFFGEEVQKKLLYYPTVTREEFTHQGRITELMASGKIYDDLGLEKPTLENDRFMLCGNPQMIADTRAMLLEWGGKEGNMNEPGHFVIEKAFVEK